VLQPFKHLLRLLAQGIDTGNLTAGVVRVFVDQFFQRLVSFGSVAMGELSQRFQFFRMLFECRYL
jgi:hypothetical protein